VRDGLVDHFWPIIRETPKFSDASSYGGGMNESMNDALMPASQVSWLIGGSFREAPQGTIYFF
jgi:hypothetical protein